MAVNYTGDVIVILTPNSHGSRWSTVDPGSNFFRKSIAIDNKLGIVHFELGLQIAGARESFMANHVGVVTAYIKISNAKSIPYKPSATEKRLKLLHHFGYGFFENCLEHLLLITFCDKERLPSSLP